MRFFPKGQKRRGVSAVETVIGITLIALVILFSVDAVARFVKAGSSHVDQAQALFLTEETLESALFVRDTKWATFQALALNTDLYIQRSGSTMSVTAAPQTVDAFTPKFRLYAVSRDAVTQDIVTSGGVTDTGTRLLVATTTWSGGSVTLSEYVTDLSP